VPIVYYAQIASENYAAFREMLQDDLPKKYERWLHIQQAQKDKERLEWESWEGTDVDVGPGEFRAWCDARNESYTRHNLDRFAQEKGGKATPP
jgi:hypothetical protein